jgi:hypothetical protein
LKELDKAKRSHIFDEVCVGEGGGSHI